MGDASYQWTSFLGGEWSGAAQGRLDLPAYRTALNVSLNGHPVEEGAWTRRSGSRRLGVSAYRASGCLRTFWMPGHQPAVCEFTYSLAAQQGFLRFWVQQYAGVTSVDMVPLCDNFVAVSAISATNPAQITLASTPPVGMNGQTWTNGDMIFLSLDPAVPLVNGALFRNKQFIIQATGSALMWTLIDPETGAAFDGSLSGGMDTQLGATTAGHIAIFATPYKTLAEVQSLRLVQTGLQAFVLSHTTTPYSLVLTLPPPNAGAPSATAPWFTFRAANFIDGPYLDPLPGTSQTGNMIGAIRNWDGYSAKTPHYVNATGQVQFYVPNAAYVFQASDVGRLIRLWCQPAPWVGGGYGVGTYQRVTYQGNFFATATIVGTTSTPGTDTTWYIEQDFGRWGYGTIASLAWDGTNSSAVVTLLNLGGNGGGLDNGTLVDNLIGGQDGNGNPTLGGDVIIDTWQLGAFTTGQFPSEGTYHEGRLILMGALPNRIDTSMSDGGSYGGFLTLPNEQSPVLFAGGAGGATQHGSVGVVDATFSPPTWATTQINIGGLSEKTLAAPVADTNFNGVFFCPTDSTGQVRDNHGISLAMNAPESNTVGWAEPYEEGVAIGTLAGEFILTGGQQGVTPASADIRQRTSYKGAFVKALRVGHALIFVQASAQRLMEYVVDPFLRRLQARHLNELAKHLTVAGIKETAYQEEKSPTIWLCMNDGTLASCVYRRLGAAFGDTPPQIMAWSRHTLANGRLIQSIVTAANQAGKLDRLMMLTNNGVDD